MPFSSLIFLFAFLPAVLAMYYLPPHRYRNAILLVFSYFFYLWGSGEFLLLLVLATLINYALGLLIERCESKTAKGWVVAAIILNLALLGYFKYANFFVGEVNRGLVVLGVPTFAWTQTVLPLGISFFTFHNIIYILDVYRGTVRANVNLVDFALYEAMFPNIIAGPIVRFSEIVRQLRGRVERLDDFYQGGLRFCWGLAKKVVIATYCAEIADAVFGLGKSALDTKTAWLGALAYSFQIYFDFSGYCDMAIGLGLMFGFQLPENFNRPYSAVSVTDFWRRWHMTLSRFFRDYLYIPLGGNRKGTERTYLNLIIVFVLCGLWHGPNWTFVLWGAYHGTLLIGERAMGLREVETAAPLSVRRFVTFLLVTVGWVFFRATDVDHACRILVSMFWPSNQTVPIELGLVLNPRNLFFLALAASVVVLPRDFSAPRFLFFQARLAGRAAVAVITVLLLLYSVILMTSNSLRPDLYAEF